MRDAIKPHLTNQLRDTHVQCLLGIAYRGEFIKLSNGRVHWVLRVHDPRHWKEPTTEKVTGGNVTTIHDGGGWHRRPAAWSGLTREVGDANERAFETAAGGRGVTAFRLSRGFDYLIITPSGRAKLVEARYRSGEHLRSDAVKVRSLAVAQQKALGVPAYIWVTRGAGHHAQVWRLSLPAAGVVEATGAELWA